MIDVIMKQLRNVQMSVNRLLTRSHQTIKYRFISVVWPEPAVTRDHSLGWSLKDYNGANEDISEARGHH